MTTAKVLRRLALISFNIGLYFCLYSWLIEQPAYEAERNQRCFVVGKMYDGAYESAKRHYHEPTYLFILHDERNRSFHLAVTPECYYEHHEGEYLYFNLAESDIRRNTKPETLELIGLILAFINAVWLLIMIINWCVSPDVDQNRF